jgi:hypothetical protein
VNLSALKQFSVSGFEAIPPEALLEAADFCHQYVEISRDVRFLLLEDCFRISDRFWTAGDAGASTSSDATSLLGLWKRHLPSILEFETEDDGVALASILRDDLRSALVARRTNLFENGSK